MTKKKQALSVAQDLITTCVNVCMYQLQLFADTRSIESKDLILREMKPDPEASKDINVHVLSIETPPVESGNYIQMIFHLSDTGIMSFLLSSLKCTSNTK